MQRLRPAASDAGPYFICLGMPRDAASCSTIRSGTIMSCSGGNRCKSNKAVSKRQRSSPRSLRAQPGEGVLQRRRRTSFGLHSPPPGPVKISCTMYSQNSPEKRLLGTRTTRSTALLRPDHHHYHHSKVTPTLSGWWMCGRVGACAQES